MELHHHHLVNHNSSQEDTHLNNLITVDIQAIHHLDHEQLNPILIHHNHPQDRIRVDNSHHLEVVVLLYRVLGVSNSSSSSRSSSQVLLVVDRILPGNSRDNHRSNREGIHRINNSILLHNREDILPISNILHPNNSHNSSSSKVEILRSTQVGEITKA